MKYLIPFLIFSFVYTAVFAVGNSEKMDTNENEMMTGNDTMIKDETMTGDDMMTGDDAMTGKDLMMSFDPDSFYKGGKTDFTTLDDAKSTAKNGPVVLFFYASWCPTCQSAVSEIDRNLDKLKNITLFIVNYDKEKDLKNKYKITYQHTFVQIDPEGKQLVIWNGGGIDKIIDNVVTERKER